MRCFICDHAIEGKNVAYDKRYEGEKYGPIAPCTPCILEIDDVFGPMSEDEIDSALEKEGISGP